MRWFLATYPAAFQALFWASSALLLLVVLHLIFSCKSWKSFFVDWAALLVSLAGLLVYKVSDHYTGNGIDESTLYQVHHGITGLSSNMIEPLVVLSGMIVLSFLLLAYLSVRGLVRRRNKERHPPATKGNHSIGLILVLTVVLNPGWLQASILASNLVNRSSYIKDIQSESVYSSPAEDGTPKSLVYIYIESMEKDLTNPKKFPGLAPGLHQLSTEGLSLDGIQEAPFTGWTIAGQTSSQCGFPTAGESIEASVDPQAFSIPCVGDFLKEKGYATAFMGGADLSFSGKGHFWETHGFKDAYGTKELEAYLQLKNPPLNDWGLNDDILLEAAFKKFKQLESSKKPFALVLLTVNTHPPHGFSTPSCKDLPPYAYGDGSHHMLNAAHCADYLVTRFVRKIQAENVKNLVVVVGGDHLQMDSSDAAPVLGPKAHRNYFWIALGDGVPRKAITRDATAFDIAPTLLGLLGYSTPAFGLGRDLLNEKTQTLPEKYGRETFFAQVKSVFTLDTQGFWTLKTSPISKPTKANNEESKAPVAKGTAAEGREQNTELHTLGNDG